MTIKTISLFSGSGGLDLGLLGAGGFELVLANDIDEAACSTYRRNIGDHVRNCDIRLLTDLPEVDLIVGGPPCQGFSLANPNRAFDDPRNWLFKEYVRVLGEAKPKVFLMENVTGLLTLDNGRVFDSIKREFRSAGYTLYEKVLNARDFGVPQSRNRVILVGVANHIPVEYSFPEPTVRPGGYATVGDAILNRAFAKDDPNHVVSRLTPLNLERVGHIPEGGSMKDCPAALHNNTDLRRSMRRLDSSRPSYTIVHNNCDHYYHPKESRRLTIREMALIQTYPPDYVFMGSKNDQSKQVGNSVPVLMAQHLAASIARFFEGLTANP